MKNRRPESLSGPDSDTPRVRHERRKADFARLLRRVLDDAGASIEAVAREAGVSATKFGRWLSPDSGEAMPLASVPALPAAVQRALVDALAEPLSLVAVARDGEPVGVLDDVRALGEVIAAASAAETSYAAAVADGRIDGQEAERVGRAAREAIRHLAGLAERMDAVARGGIDGLRRGPRKEGT